jgi:hypothetical protein
MNPWTTRPTPHGGGNTDDQCTQGRKKEEKKKKNATQRCQAPRAGAWKVVEEDLFRYQEGNAVAALFLPGDSFRNRPDSYLHVI